MKIISRNENMWNNLGFRENPYDTKPLKVNSCDVDLLMGRDKEQIKFLTAMESDKQGVFIISGVPGVGKTSFFNIQQYLLESGNAEFGPRLLAARTLCPIQAYDDIKEIALRCIQSFCKSIEEYCLINSIAVPSLCCKIQNWLYQNKPASFNFGFSIMGNGLNYGREVNLPSCAEVTFETHVEILKNLAQEVKNQLGLEGSFIALDNIENLHEEDLKDYLATFRDTIFLIPNIWWVVIGQSGLSSLIQSSNPKVFQRLSGSIELKPISVDDLIKAVNIRVSRFHDSVKSGKSPITTEVYLKLFESSNGEIRFVFKYCQTICIHLVQSVRNILKSKNALIDEKSFHKEMGKFLIKQQIDNEYSMHCLKEIIEEEFDGLFLSVSEKQVLKQIGELHKVKPSDFHKFKDFGIKTMQKFTKDYLTNLSDLNLLLRRQEGKIVTYELRGVSVFAIEFGFVN